MKAVFVFFMLMLSSINIIEASPVGDANGFVKNHASWIKKCQDNRVYLEANRLTLSEEGIYVMDDFNEPIPLSEVYSDSNGIYTKLESLEPRLERTWGKYGVVWCHTCRAIRDLDKEGKCRICGNYP